MGRRQPVPFYVGQPLSEEAPCVSSQTQVKRQRKESLNLWRKNSSAQGRFWQTSSPNNIRAVFTNAESSAWLREHPLPSGLPGRGRRPDRRMRLAPACARSSRLPKQALPPWRHWPPFFANPGESLTPGRWARAEERGVLRARGRAGGRVGHARKGTAGLQKKHAVSPQGVETRGFIQTHLCGFSVGVFTNHVTTQILQRLA